jgi:hypothetical protein
MINIVQDMVYPNLFKTCKRTDSLITAFEMKSQEKNNLIDRCEHCLWEGR